MNIDIRKIQNKDKSKILEMMRGFYSSDAVFTDGSEEIFNADIDNCIADNPYVEGYVFESDGNITGYGMLAKSFSTEFGKRCVWIEDIYVKKEYRGQGIGSLFLKFVEDKYPFALLRLEVESTNTHAINVYKKCGFGTLPYLEMKK